ncbi:MAG TPA: sigma factor, partial [Gemmatimonadaceae bacterium]|nr:sigma factor [Gemmatimonadaceae bacterium]
MALIDATALARLFQEHHGSLYRYLTRLSGDADVAADAAQEVFVRLIERPPSDGVERAWLYKVGTNLVLEGSRTRTRRAL